MAKKYPANEIIAPTMHELDGSVSPLWVGWVELGERIEAALLAERQRALLELRDKMCHMCAKAQADSERGPRPAVLVESSRTAMHGHNRHGAGWYFECLAPFDLHEQLAAMQDGNDSPGPGGSPSGEPLSNLPVPAPNQQDGKEDKEP